MPPDARHVLRVAPPVGPGGVSERGRSHSVVRARGCLGAVCCGVCGELRVCECECEDVCVCALWRE